MATNSSENDALNQSEDQAPGVGPQKPNDKQSLCEKINKNSALNLSWADMLDELESDGTVLVRETKTIVAGPERPEAAGERPEAAGTQRKDPRIVIPRDPSAYPGFPLEMGKFESAKAFGQAVILYWHEHRIKKRKEKEKAKKAEDRAKKEAERLRVAKHNEKVVGSDSKSGQGSSECGRDSRERGRDSRDIGRGRRGDRYRHER